MRLHLTDARKRRGLTPEALAERAGVHRATVYRIEAGEITNPTNATVERLETALRLRRGTLLFGAMDEARAS
jgi:transcriptional regulator with XRE-family HTH domain